MSLLTHQNGQSAEPENTNHQEECGTVVALIITDGNIY